MANWLKKLMRSQLVIPLFALLLLIIFNLIRDVGFFSLNITTNNDGNTVLSGNIISILNSASELAVLSIGMTLVTASSKGQDISVGAVAAIAGSVFVRVLKEHTINWPIILLGFICACLAAILCGAFNGTLVSVFKIQPMIATLILLTAGRPIAYWINGGATPTVESPLLSKIGSFIPGIPIPTPIIIVVVFAILVSLVLRFTNLGLYTQAVGINEKSARLNGINAIGMKMLSFMMLGICVAIAGCIGVSRMGLINHETLLLDIEMDAILAVAIGGNALSGGKFSIAGSVIGAYIIQALTITLYAMKVPSTAVKAYKAIVIIAIVVLGSPVVQSYLLKLRGRLFQKSNKEAGAQAYGD
ncbi:MAG: ABC transporter permease [Eubacteriales bacterium]|nr:ABC transporter permease [Eubacteriales bacterium]